MKKQFTFFLFVAFLFCSFMDANAQSYKSAIGLRLGYPWALTYKTFISQQGALEVYAAARQYGYIGYNYGWISINGAYQHHFPLNDVLDGLQWYVGGGAGLQFWHFDDNFPNAGSNQSVSLQAYLGVDYKFDEIPLNLTLDWVPNIYLNGYTNGFYGRSANLGVRYVLK